MAEAWYCLIGGRQSGPLSAAQLREMAGDGRLLPEDSLRNGPSGPWVPAVQVKGLFSGHAAADTAGALPARTGGSSTPPRSRPLPRAKPVTPGEEERAPAQPAARGEPAAASGPMPRGPVPPPIPAPVGPAPPPARSADDPGSAFDFLEEAYDRPPQPEAAPKTVKRDPLSRRRNQQILVWVLVGLLGLLAVLLFLLFIFTQGGGGVATTENLTTAVRREAREQREAKKIFESVLDDSGQKEKARAAKDAGPVQWLEAGKDAWKGGDLTLRILAAEIVRPMLRDGSGRRWRPKEPCLVVKFEAANTNASRRIEYTKWPANSMGVKLLDGLGNEYFLTGFPGGVTVEGEQAAASIPPKKSVEGLLIFPKPRDDAKSLRLLISAEAFQEDGSAYFEIPKAMVVSFQAPPSGKQPAAAQGTAPVVRRRPLTLEEELDSKPTGRPEEDFGFKAYEGKRDAAAPKEEPPATRPGDPSPPAEPAKPDWPEVPGSPAGDDRNGAPPKS